MMMNTIGAKTVDALSSTESESTKKMKPINRLNTLYLMQDLTGRMMSSLKSDLDILHQLHKQLRGSFPLTEHVGVDWSMAHVGSSLLDLDTRLKNMDTLLEKAIRDLNKGQDASTTI